jgi:predicted ArsR family transcriptional regulator
MQEIRRVQQRSRVQELHLHIVDSLNLSKYLAEINRNKQGNYEAIQTHC